MTAVETLTAAEALRHCRTITRTRARNFYYGLKLLPEPQRSALYAIYAWMRRADDLVDDCTEGAETARRRLDEFSRATDAALAGDPVSEEPLWIGLADTASRFDIHRDLLHAMIEGQLEDVEGRRYETFEQLRSYCHRVASSVGLICIEVWGYQDDSARQLAIDRGVAFQLTNILRDFKDDYDNGRVYLPLDSFREFDLEPDALRRWEDPQRGLAFLRHHVDVAERTYRRSEGLEELITPTCVPTLWTMTSIYRRLLRKIAAEPGQIITGRRLRLSAAHKGAIALQAVWRRQQVRTRVG